MDLEDLRAELKQHLLQMSEGYAGAGAWPLEKIRAKLGDYGVLGKILLLPHPADGVPLLKEALAHDNSLIVLDAAAILTVLGDTSGLAPLEECLAHRPPVTNSGYERDVIAAVLALHGEPFRPAFGPNPTSLRPLLLRLLRR